jgi:hypothetical protein
MNRIIKLVVLVFGIAFSALVTAEPEFCPPQPPWTQPIIADGALASEGQMIKVQKEVSTYVKEIEYWNSCNEYVHGLQSGRMLLRAKAIANAYNVELERHLHRDQLGNLAIASKKVSVPSKN